MKEGQSTNQQVIVLPTNVRLILERLTDAGEEAYLAGGCVRDQLLGLTPKDWDVATSALPDKVKSLFKRTVDTGIEHGTVTVVMDKKGYEVTTFRVDGDYHDHRRPESVSFTRSLAEDVKRRDFTINAMVYSPQKGLIDYYDGQKDLADGVIRCVGNPDERFEEDALRILRAIRFAARFGYRIEDQTKKAMRRHRALLKRVSVERIRVELEGVLLADYPQYFQQLQELNLQDECLPTLRLPVDSVGQTFFYRIWQHLPKDKPLRLSWLLTGWGEKSKSTISRQLKSLTFDNKTTMLVSNLLVNMTAIPDKKPESIRQWLSRVGFPLAEQLITLWQTWLSVVGGPAFEKWFIRWMGINLTELTTDRLQFINREVTVCRQAGYPLKISDLAVNGHDLQTWGIVAGPAIGEWLHRMLDWVLIWPEENSLMALRKFWQCRSGQKHEVEQDEQGC